MKLTKIFISFNNKSIFGHPNLKYYVGIEVHHWLIYNVGEGGYVCHIWNEPKWRKPKYWKWYSRSISKGSYFYFEDKDAATLFKLTWG